MVRAKRDIGALVVVAEQNDVSENGKVFTMCGFVVMFGRGDALAKVPQGLEVFSLLLLHHDGSYLVVACDCIKYVVIV